MDDIFDEFASALRTKFQATLKRHPDRSDEPWFHYGIEFLEDRLEEEWIEYKQADNPEDKAGEALDVAEFALFIWKNKRAQIPIGR